MKNNINICLILQPVSELDFSFLEDGSLADMDGWNHERNLWIMAQFLHPQYLTPRFDLIYGWMEALGSLLNLFYYDI